LTGHSMGGGCAALLCMLLRSDDADVAAAVRRGVLATDAPLALARVQQQVRER
jgi:hypothetical protein